MAVNIHLLRTQRPHFGTYSGISQFLKYIDHNKYYIDVHTISDSDKDFPIQNRVVQRCVRYIGHFNGMKNYKLSDFTAEVKAVRKCWQSKVDIIHYIDGEHSAQYLPWLFKHWGKFQTKIVATFHQPPELLASLTSKKIIAKLDYVTVVSPQQIPYFQELLAPDKIFLVLHGIDTDYFRPMDTPKPGRKFKCITVGHWLRDFRVIREVAEKLAAYKNIEFHVVTSKVTGPSLTGLEGLTNIIIYREGLDDTSLLRLYQQSDILFLPLIQSTANNALLEGIACGLPVVSTCLPSIKAYLPGEEAVLIKGNDPEQFIDTILYLASHPEDRRHMALAARKRAEGLDWRHIAPQYEKVYSRIINDKLSCGCKEDSSDC